MEQTQGNSVQNSRQAGKVPIKTGNNRHSHIITIFTELYTVEAEIFVED